MFRKEIRKAKRATSTAENPDSDQRHTGRTPVPGLLNEVERSHKAKTKRKTRQATTGVTLDVIKQAKELAKKNENKPASSYDRNTERMLEKLLPPSFNINFSRFFTERIYSKRPAQGRAVNHQRLVKSEHCETRDAKETVRSEQDRKEVTY